MDARGRDWSQSYRAGTKRPWEDDTTLQKQSNGGRNGWYGGTLPPIEAGPFSRHSAPDESGAGPVQNNSYFRNGRESVAKKVRYEGNDYIGDSRKDLDVPGRMPQFRGHNTKHDQNGASQDAPTISHIPRATIGGQANDPQDNLCRQCRQPTLLDQDKDSLPECCEHCQKNPELALIMQAAASGLTNLTETLRSGIASEKRGVNPAHSQLRLLPSGNPPPIIDFGLKQTLHWLLAKIEKVNELADKFVHQVPPGASKLLNNGAHHAINGVTRDGSFDIMKRRMDEELQRPPLEDLNTSDARTHQRRRSLALNMQANEDLPSIRTQSPYHQTPLSMDNTNQRFSIMNPPPPPTRQLPSPPGRSFPSPTSVNFSSPLSSSFGNPSTGPAQPSPLHASGNVLPPIASVQSSDTALQAHTAALQHEVSIQKIALSSLQGEHDKLLAAFSRSQSRATALEKKHQVSDGEIFSLTEEKSRLQVQVQELEGDVEELSKSRDSYRQAAVQEGAQYVEIVKMASQLEEKTGEERKGWNKLKQEMEQRMAELSNARNTHAKESSSIPESTDTPPSSGKEKIDSSRTKTTTALRSAKLVEDEVADREEIKRLRKRCEEVEAALRAVRDESLSMENIVEALSKAGKGILRRVESVTLEAEADAEVESEPKSQSNPQPEIQHIIPRSENESDPINEEQEDSKDDKA